MRYPSDRHRKAPEGAKIPLTPSERIARLTAERDALREALEEATDLAEAHGWAPAQRVHWRKTLNSTDGDTR